MSEVLFGEPIKNVVKGTELSVGDRLVWPVKCTIVSVEHKRSPGGVAYTECVDESGEVYRCWEPFNYYIAHPDTSRVRIRRKM